MVTYDSEKGGVFQVHIPGKSSLYFPCYSNGVHIHECSSEGFSSVETIAENKKGYQKRQIYNTDRVGSFIKTIRNPSERDLRTLIRSGAILNCPIIIEDVNTFYSIYKKNTLALKGNTTRKKPDKQNTSVIKVPTCILDKHTIVTLYIDIFFISKMSFLGSIAKDLI